MESRELRLSCWSNANKGIPRPWLSRTVSWLISTDYVIEIRPTQKTVIKQLEENGKKIYFFSFLQSYISTTSLTKRAEPRLLHGATNTPVTGRGVGPCASLHGLTDTKSVATIYIGTCKCAVRITWVRKWACVITGNSHNIYDAGNAHIWTSIFAGTFIDIIRDSNHPKVCVYRLAPAKLHFNTLLYIVSYGIRLL